MISTLKQEEIEEIIEDSYLPVLVKFGAKWCQPCRTLEPILEKLAEEFDQRVLFYYVDVDESKELTEKYQVTGVPTVLIFKDEQIIRTVGLRNKKFYEDELNK